MRKTSKNAPQGLSADARELWVTFVDEYSIKDTGGLQILEQALSAYDRAAEAKAILDRDGIVCVDKARQTIAHPCVVIEKNSRAQYLAALKALGLNVIKKRPRPGRPGEPRR